MKKVLIFILLFSSMKGFCQFPNNLWQGSKFQLTGQLGGVGSELGYQIRTSFADTTAANSYSGGFLKNIAGFTIRTVDDFWSRSNNLQKWNKINGGGSGGSGGGIVSLGNVGNYGLILVNDSTYRVDTLVISTRARLMHVADSLLAIIGASSNLGNSDLTQTDDERFYNGDGKILYFSNLKSFNISTDSFPQFYFNTESGSEIARFHFDNSGNTGIGYQVFQDIKVDSAEANNANGRSALRAFIAGQGNTANGSSAMSNFLRGSNNLAGGIGSMDVLENGSRNVGLGPYIFGSINSLEFNNNTGVGYRAGFNETRSNMTYYGTIPNLPADTDPTALQDTTETPIYINGNSLEGYWNQSLNIRDSAKIGMHRISADSDSAYTKDPITGKVSYAKINGGGSGVTSVATNNGTGITGGTITTTGTLAIDTLQISTRAWRQNGIDSVTSLLLAKQDTVKQIGTWVNEAFASSPSGWASYAYSPSFSSGMVLPANGGTVFSGFAYMNSQYTASLNYSQQAEITLTTLGPINSGGVMVGRRSANPVQGCQNEFIFRMTGANTGKIYFYTVYNSTETLQDSSLEITVNAGDTIRIYAALSQTNAYARVAKLTAGKETETAALNYKYSPIAADLQQPANTGAVWMAGLGTSGSYKCINYLEKHYENPLSKLLIVGNSIATRYDASNLPSHWSRLAFDKVGFSNTSGGGDRFVEGLLRTAEIRLFNSQYVLFEYGTNDAASDFRTYGVPFIDSIQAMGKTPIWLKMFNTTAKDTVAYNISREQNIRLVDCGRTNIPTPNNGAHYTDDGNQAVAYILQSELADIIGYTGGNELIKQTVEIDAGTTTINDGLNNRLVYQDNSGKFNVSNNLYWTESTGKLGVGVLPTGRFDAGTTLRIQGFEAPASGEGMEMLYNSSQGYIYAYDRTGNNYRDVIIGQGGNQIFVKGSSSRVGINNSSPTALLHLAAGTATAGTAPIKLNTGTALTTPEDGAIEYHGSHIYFTIGSTRYQLDQQSVPLSSITAATGSNTINNANNAQTWQWNSLSGSSAMSLSSNSTAKINTSALFSADVSGALATSGITTYATKFSNTHTGTTVTNIAGRLESSGSTHQNIAGSFAATGTSSTNTAGSFYADGATSNTAGSFIVSGGAASSNRAGYFYAFTSGGTPTINTGGEFTATGTATTNIGGSFSASSGTNNYAIIVPASGGSVGIGNSAPTSLLHVSGSFSAGYVAKTANYTATIADYTINCTANTFQVTLPTAVGIAGRLYVITNSGAGTITVGTTSSETFANVVATPTTLTMAAVGSRTVQSDGANWLLLSSL